MATKSISTHWPTWKKIIFRISFLFLLYFTFDYLYFTFAIIFRVNQENIDFAQMLSFLSKPLYWLDTHLYHIGYNPKKNSIQGGDAAFGVVLYISVFICCVVVGTVWSWLDRKRPSYNKLYYWFRVYLRYAVAIIMISYGADKLIPVQMSYPNSITLLGRVGDQSLFNVLWNFMGASPGYEMFTGLCEIVASLLLLFRRTYVFGCLFMCTILTNVVALNIFYNVNVKMSSSLLLISVLYLLAPFFQTLIRLFFFEQKVSFAERSYHFQSKKIKYILNVSAALLISIFLISSISGNLKSYDKELAGRGSIYDVTSFVTKNSLPANITDTLKWKRLALFGHGTTKYAVIYYSNQEAGDWYNYDIDTTRKTFNIRDAGGSIIHHYVFNYDPAIKNNLNLTGKFKNYDVIIKMKPVMDSMFLNMEKIKLVQDY